MGSRYPRLQPRLRLYLETPEGKALGPELAGLLLMIERTGSIRGAARLLGIPYSRAWDLLRSAEASLGAPLVEGARGGRRGGGARLTGLGRHVLGEYLRWHRALIGTEYRPPTGGSRDGYCMVYGGSHDPLVERALGLLREEGRLYEPVWTGSTAGALMVMLGEAELAGVHVCGGGECNTGLYRRLGLQGAAVLVRGFERLLGLVSRRPYRSVEEAIDHIASGGAVVAWRQPGSGSRMLLEELLREGGAAPEDVRGAGPYPTHLSVAEAVARGEADVGVAHQSAAVYYGLHFLPVRWERYDILASTTLGDPVGEARRLLLAAARIAGALPGYRIPEGMGEVLAG